MQKLHHVPALFYICDAAAERVRPLRVGMCSDDVCAQGQTHVRLRATQVQGKGEIGIDRHRCDIDVAR